MRVFRVEQALKKLGRDIQDARKRRRISTSLMAERIGITRATLSRLEAGDPKVSMGSYAIALYVLGKLDELEKIIDRTRDPLGLDLMDEQLPVRIRTGRQG
ncbi:helix-turn-helix transcriptional regulator [Sodalis sp. dw_96]|jgi:transcriptional regulator with XRE-family HTH domain|uniref:helix-turn-helix domain-containing protein n=1 Tax=Sodalis sp. dw_96 TaxID=2719794 RepID=UPI001BD1D790|nr:helix-turn-helix transcriptional regulator [Sodalis sp. dw_96]